MNITLKKDRFEAIDHCFSELKQSKKHETSNLKEMETLLKETFHKDIKVQIVYPNKPSDTFFVMSIFPDESTLDAVVRCIVEEKNDEIIRKIWNETNNWTIEIDNRLFNENYIQLTSQEMTALLLHELGHMIYSNSIPQRISKVMKLEYARASIGIKAVLKDSLFSKILTLPILNACTYDNYKTKDDIRKELKADVFVVKMGYGKYLESALEKFIETNKVDTSKNIGKTSQDVYSDMKGVTLFSIGIIENFKDRKSVLAKKKLADLGGRVPSSYINKFIFKIDKDLTKSNGGMTDSDKMKHIEEAVNDIIDGAYMKEFFIFNTKKLKRIDPRDIDYIELQSQSIKSNNDRMILVNYIYTKLDLIEYYIKILESPKYSKKYDIPDSIEKLKSYRQRLLKVRDYVMNYKIPEVKYGIDITYPVGYEG